MDSPTHKHVVCFPLPLQGHINPMLKLAKLLNNRGFHITFIHSEHNIRRLLQSSTLLHNTDTFRYESLTDGLSLSHSRGVTDLPKLCQSMPIHTLTAFRELMRRIPPVSCVIADGVMSFTMKVAEEMGIPVWLLFTPSACGMLGYFQFEHLVETELFPLKDDSYLTNGFLDRPIDWIPGWETVKLKHIPSFFRTTDSTDVMFNYNLQSLENATRSNGIILNTFEAFEHETLDIIRSYQNTTNRLPNLYTIGPVSLLLQSQSYPQTETSKSSSSLWKEETECLEWLDRRDPGSVVYVNYGSLAVVNWTDMREFAWGLANSGCYFLWVIRPDMVDDGPGSGSEVVVSREFMAEVMDRALLSKWCPQERVLEHEAVGVFVTHCGWNSVLESVVAGVPMICWPFFAEQEMNCLYVCDEEKWGIGVEMTTEEGEVRREKVEAVVKEVMCGGEKGDLVRWKVKEWRRKAVQACEVGGSSLRNFDELVKCLSGGRDNKSSKTKQI